jgi:uncharacterized protein with GYD domain
MDKIVLFEDVRNKPGKHKNIHAYCEKMGIKIIRQCLNSGDYQIANKGDIVVDTKSGVGELSMDIFHSHERFRRQCQRAQECGIQLIILVEEALPEGRLDKWVSPLGRDGKPLFLFDPARLRKAMYTMQEKYGVKFRFCDGRSTGKYLIEYLKGERT